MLRITPLAEAPPRVTLKVEGRIAGEGVRVLEGECSGWIDRGYYVELDFAEVASVDHAGVVMLQQLPRSNVEIVNALPFIEALLAEE
ncbi:MAG: hypothetical protein GTN78_25780 [Gemmatimonadales bacterium]|nr:hypothetical protein [Gemmatimonadales bacterium]NIN12570.1 hypothetical protein [Gemmatimonadales bacterium]NIR03565.1 hypothetical protein [Gemmatimonadales bacterium]NIS65887.1 hypothetical protein [Gemmatimonadales bacterium]